MPDIAKIVHDEATKTLIDYIPTEFITNLKYVQIRRNEENEMNSHKCSHEPSSCHHDVESVE